MKIRNTSEFNVAAYRKLVIKQERLNIEIDKLDGEIESCSPDDANNLLRKRDRKTNDLSVVTALVSQHLMCKQYDSSSYRQNLMIVLACVSIAVGILILITRLLG